MSKEVTKSFPNPKLFSLPVKIHNDTKDDFFQITIQHRSNDNQFQKPNVVHIPCLKKGQSVTIQQWPFGNDAPSTTLNVLYNVIPFVGWIVPVAKGWGKDYWSIFCKTSKMKQVLSTDTWAQSWFANVYFSDVEKGVTITFNWQQFKSSYWVSLYRKSCGQSTRYLEVRGHKNPIS